MRNDLSDITVVLDRSGSMASCRADAEGGLNEFVRKQKELPGEALFTLVQFDNHYEFVHKGLPIKLVPDCKLEPRGGTALNDALGRAISETGERLRGMPEKDRPGLVVFVVITDGEENSSHEYTKGRIKEMIEHQQKVYNWKFTFLGANIDAFTEGLSYGVLAGAAANYTPKNTQKAFQISSDKVGVMRAQCFNSVAPDDFTYTSGEIKELTE